MMSDTGELLHIDNRLRATEKVSHDLLHVEETGQTALGEYLRTGMLSKLNLKTFADIENHRKSTTLNKKHGAYRRVTRT